VLFAILFGITTATPDLRGMMPYMLIVIVCMVIMYLWPGMTLWLPR
jgi:TRAP-type mannitol/chloroaromatic compound transport system permease large subunit